MTLLSFTTANLFYAFVVFCRIGGSFFFLPGVGESFVPTKIKLMIAVSLTIFACGVTAESAIPMPDSSIEIFLILISEISIGLCFGLISKILLSSLYTAGHIISSNIGLSSASMFDPTQHDQGTVIGNLLNITTVVIILSLNLHIFVIDAIIISYETLPVGSFFAHHVDFSALITQAVLTSWNVGVRFAAPFIISSILIYLGAGVLARLMPQLQIFFLLMPVQVMVGFIMLMMVLSATLLWFVDEYKSIISQFMNF